MKRQIYLTPAEGKKLIGKALARKESVLTAAKEHTLVLISGTTNGYVAKEIAAALGLGEVNTEGFFRGIYLGPLSKEKSAPRDIAFSHGQMITDKLITEWAPEMGAGDMIMKGGNAVFLPDREVGVVIGNDKFGTLAPITEAVYGRRATLLMPVGLEKRVEEPISELAEFVNAPDCTGTRLAFAPGKAYTELDALEDLGVEAKLLAGGGVAGFEGSVLLGIEGTEEEIEAVMEVMRSVKGEKIYGM